MCADAAVSHGTDLVPLAFLLVPKLRNSHYDWYRRWGQVMMIPSLNGTVSPGLVNLGMATPKPNVASVDVNSLRVHLGDMRRSLAAVRTTSLSARLEF